MICYVEGSHLIHDLDRRAGSSGLPVSADYYHTSALDSERLVPTIMELASARIACQRILSVLATHGITGSHIPYIMYPHPFSLISSNRLPYAEPVLHFILNLDLCIRAHISYPSILCLELHLHDHD